MTKRQKIHLDKLESIKNEQNLYLQTNSEKYNKELLEFVTNSLDDLKKNGRMSGLNKKYRDIVSLIESKSVSGKVLGNLTSIRLEYGISNYNIVYKILKILIKNEVIRKEMYLYIYK